MSSLARVASSNRDVGKLVARRFYRKPRSPCAPPCFSRGWNFKPFSLVFHFNEKISLLGRRITLAMSAPTRKNCFAAL
jgi:hypothetical protein